MPYGNPAYMWDHLGASIGAAAISTKYATAAGFGKERLIDYQGARLMKFAGSQADHDIEFDLNAFEGPIYDRVVIPNGHNLSTKTIRVYAGDTSPAATEIGSVVATAGWIDLAVTLSTNRYVRVLIDATGTWELGELWIGRRYQTETGIARDWQEPLRTPSVEIEFPSREAVMLLAAPRRRYLIEHQGLSDASGDEFIYRELSVRARATPILFWTPRASPSVLIARLEEDAEKTQDHPQPASALSWTYGLHLREQAL